MSNDLYNKTLADFQDRKKLSDKYYNEDEANKLDEILNHIPTEEKISKINEKSSKLFENPNSPVNTIEDLLSRWKMSKEKGVDSLLQNQENPLSNPALIEANAVNNTKVDNNDNFKPQINQGDNLGLNPILANLKKPEPSLSKSGEIALTPNQLSQMSVNNPEQIDKVNQQTSAPNRNISSINSNQNKSKNQNKSLDTTKELDPLEQFKQLLKLEEEKQKASQDELSQANQNRDITAALAQISKGISQAGAAYGGGSVTQLKPDTMAADAIVQSADQKIADIKEKIKTASENDKRILEKQLTLAQLQKMKDDKATDKAKLGLESRKLDIEQMKVNSEIAKNAAEMKKKELGLNLTKAQETADKDYAKKYTQWATAGGRETLQAKLNELADAKKELLKGEVMTSGPIAGSLPRILNPKASAMKDKMDTIIVDTLRPTLGAQFTAQEGEAIKKLNYDPTMEQKYNIPKIDLLMKKLADKIQANDKLASEYESVGTIAHLKPITEAAKVQSESQNKIEQAPYGNEVERNGKVYIWNPSVGKYQIK